MIGTHPPARLSEPIGAVEPAPPQADPTLLELLRDDLASYTVDAVAELLGPVAHRALGREQPLPAVRALEAHLGPQATLAATFLLGRATTRRALDAALPRTGTDGALRLGIVEAAGSDPLDEVRATVDLRPYGAVDGLGAADWWVASDLGELATGRRLSADHVLGVGGASTTLAGFTVRRPAERVLDLGAGCGVQSLHAARHARSVVATDISARALAFARFTWELNRPALGDVGFDTRLGSMLVPVAGERFDLVVSNPPFVISPRVPDVPVYTYRDAGLPGDDLVHDLVRTVGEVLTEGGVAQFLGNWEFRRGEAWRDRVASWFDDLTPESGRLDAWVVQREVQDPAEYAETWLRDGGQPRGPEFDRLYRAWLDDFDSRGVEGIGFGLVTLRRCDEPPAPRPPLRRFEEQRGGDPAGFGDHVADVLAAHDWLTAHGGSLREHRFSVAPDVTEERHYRPGDDDPAVIQLRQGGGFGRVLRASTSLAAVVGACDGGLTLGRITGAVAHLLDTSESEVWGDVAADLTELIQDGMLIPVDAAQVRS